MAEGKSYKFTLKKKKEYTVKFKPLKEKSVGMDKIREIALAFIKTKTGKGDVKSAETMQKNKPILKGVMRKLFVYLGAVLILIGIIFAYILFMMQGAGIGVVAPVAREVPSLQLDIIDYGLANINGHGVYTPYVILHARGNNVKEIGVFMEASDGPLYDGIYVLNSRREQGSRYSEFKDELQREFSKFGVSVNEIYLEELESLPEGSHPLIIVPTGFMPASLASPHGSGKNAVELTRKGATIIYIGFGFDQGLMDERRGRIFPGTDYSVEAVSTTLGIDITSTRSSLDGMLLKDVRYGVVPAYQKNVQYTADVKLANNGIPVVNWGGQGYLVIIPNTLDSGWNNGKEAATDIAMLIKNAAWLKEYDRYIEATPESYYKLEDSNDVYETLITKGKAGIQEGYARIYTRAYNENNEIVDVKSKYLKISKTQKGSISNSPYALSEKISGRTFDVEAYFNESIDRFKQATEIRLRLINSSGEIADEIFFGAQYILPIDYTLKSVYDPKIEHGVYIIRLDAPSTPPYTFAKSVLIVPQINLIPERIDWKEQMFVFSLEVPELEGEDITSSLKDTYVVIDDKIRQKISTTQSGEKTFAYFKVDTPLEEGRKHTFRFEVQKGLVYESVSSISRMYYEQWWFWFVIVLTMGIVAIGIAFKAREKVKYSLDIPEFEARAKKKIYVKKDMIFDIFERINAEYGWERMPLSLKEIKNGFRKISYMGRPILIGDYNTQIILDKLMHLGDIKMYLDLYALSKWETDRYNYKYLAMFRKMRDILIPAAIPFTKLGEREDCDTYIKMRNENLKIIICTGENLLERIERAISGEERTVLLFADDDSKREFIESISKYGKRGASIKIALLNETVIPLTINEFSEFIR
ncbi:MAG: hypothetical protein ACP5KJ_00145 [Candidatus Micrarchaeia archaeon]